MAHEIETMAYFGEVPWHGLGVRVSEEATRDRQRMIIEAGLDWTVRKERMVLATDGNPVPDAFAIRREVDGRVLGVVGKNFVPTQNDAAFRWFDPFIESGEAFFHTAGSLRGGKRVWILAKLNRDPIVVKGDDVVDKYLLLAHGHDGLMAHRLDLTPVRVVCNNTLRLAFGDASSQLIRVRHTAAAEENLRNIRATIDAVNAQFEATADQYRRLAHRDINQGDVLKYVKLVFGVTGEITPRAQKNLDRIVEAVEAGMGQDLPGVSGTWWAAYNGVTEYLSHERGRSQDTRLDSLWFGQGANINQRALDLALQFAA